MKQYRCQEISGMGIILLLLFCSLSVNAQMYYGLQHIPETKWLQLAEEQFRYKEYPMALQSEALHSRTGREDPSLFRTLPEGQQAAYIRVISLLEQDQDGAADSARNFMHRCVHPAYVQRTAFAAAGYYFRKREFQNALPLYEAAGISNLANDEAAIANFERAYCYFNHKEFEKAKPLFASVTDVPGKYYAPANYYFGLLAYHNGYYEAALSSFKKISDEPYYRNVVPYYVAEIHYFNGDRKKALEEALRLIGRADKLYYDNELHLLAAQILFEEQRYGDALPYFEHYYDHTELVRKEELYEMAYSYYRVEEWKNAIDKFRPLSNTRDSLGQAAMYLLGDCYLRMEDKKGARNAFAFCADMPYNKPQQENALMLYSKLSTELGYPVDAIAGLRTLLQLFPETAYKTDAQTLLSSLYLRTRNYEAAYAALDQGNERDPSFRKAFQKVAYSYAMQQMREENLPFAATLLDRSLRYPEDADYTAAAHFWKAEILIRTGKPEESIPHLRQFMNSPVHPSRVSRPATLAQASLSLGYSMMTLGDYQEAERYFLKARNEDSLNSYLVHTALLREGDAAFMQKKFREALMLYDQIILTGHEEADYARIQKARIQGIQDKLQEKTAILRSVMNKVPVSPYAREARYELGVTQIEMDQYQQAIQTLEPLTGTEGKDYTARSLLKTGFAWQALQRNGKAVAAYKQVLESFPASEERPAALDALRSIYTEDNKPEEYAALLRAFPFSGDENNRIDSTYYAAAEAQIASGKWKEAQQALRAYIGRYPNGAFSMKARYYKAESHYQLQQYTEALADYDSLLLLPWNEFTESSAKRAAEIAYRRDDFQAAIAYYSLLRTNAMHRENLQAAYSGLLHTSYKAGDYTGAALFADTLLSLSEPGDQALEEIRFYKARSLQQQQQYQEALVVYLDLRTARNSVLAAEAGYRAAQIYFQNRQWKEAEEEAARLIQSAEGHEYWVVKAYILLADVLTEQKDYFNAKATLQSILKNAKDASLKAEASKKLEIVKGLEKQESKLKVD